MCINFLKYKNNYTILATEKINKQQQEKLQIKLLNYINLNLLKLKCILS